MRIVVDGMIIKLFCLKCDAPIDTWSRDSVAELDEIVEVEYQHNLLVHLQGANDARA